MEPSKQTTRETVHDRHPLPLLPQVRVRVFLTLILFVFLITRVESEEHGKAHFDVNDISFLWPAPENKDDVDKLISIDEMAADGVAHIVPDEDFKAAIGQAQNTIVKMPSGTPLGISFPPNNTLANPHNWKIAGIRVDPSAPGADNKTIAEFGSFPEIRLIVQPVTVDGSGKVKIHDFAMHLVFDFIAQTFAPPVMPGFPPRGVPDKESFRQVLKNLEEIKALANAANVATEGDLDVHPGFRHKVPGFTDALRSLIKNHLTGKRLDAMAFMGTMDASEPWIFFAMRRAGEHFDVLKHPSLQESTAQLLTFHRGGLGVHVVPNPANTNFNGGVDTSILFSDNVQSRLDSQLFPAATIPQLKAIKLRNIPDIIANPKISHFLNTDCVSCHSESARREELGADSGNDGFTYQRPTGISGVIKAVLPSDIWNVHNFGWFPFTSPHETITMRAANEAGASAEFINREYFGQELATNIPLVINAPVNQIVAANLGRAPSEAPAAPPASAAVPLAIPAATPASKPEGDAPPVANALTLIMTINSPQDLLQLKAFLAGAQDPNNNQINAAMNKLGLVHFARFVFLSDEKLAVITNFDGSFERYIGAFTNEIGPIFDALLVHMANHPPLPVNEHQDEFLEYVRKNDLSNGQPGYSAYPQLGVQDILLLQKNAAK